MTPRIPGSGPVTTLCGQTLAEGTYVGSDTVADCTNCIRRSRDQSRISSAFFEQEEGSELLRLSLEQARQRKPERKTDALGPEEERRPVLRLVPSPPSVPESVGDLVTDGFKPAGQGVWRSPGGVVVRMSGPNRDRFAELVFDGSVVATRDATGMRLRAGDVDVRISGDELDVRIKRR